MRRQRIRIQISKIRFKNLFKISQRTLDFVSNEVQIVNQFRIPQEVTNPVLYLVMRQIQNVKLFKPFERITRNVLDPIVI